MRAQHAATITVPGVFFATPEDVGAATLSEAAQAAASFSADAISRGHRIAPALMLGLIMLAAIPLLVLSARVGPWLRHPPQIRWRNGSRKPSNSRSRSNSEQCSGHAFLEVVGASEARFAILRDMLRIGREEDNDIRIASNSVHRYHAAIHREDFGDYRIIDLTGDNGSILLNGQRCEHAVLKDGDVIELGSGRLRFHAGLI